MKISVIIPTYKPKEYLWECLNSLISQTFPKTDFEVILVLNGCAEPWQSKIEDYISINMSDMIIKFLQTDVGGVSNARNIALDAATGEYVIFIDDDDYVSSGYLEHLINKADHNTVVLSNTIAFDDYSKAVIPDFPLSFVYKRCSNIENVRLSSIARKFFSGPCMKLIPMTFIQTRRFDVRFKNGEDSLFMFLISDNIKSIRFSSEEAIYYRRYRESSAITCKGPIKDRFINSLKLIREYCLIALKYRVDFLFFITRVLAAIKSIFITY